LIRPRKKRWEKRVVKGGECSKRTLEKLEETSRKKKEYFLVPARIHKRCKKTVHKEEGRGLEMGPSGYEMGQRNSGEGNLHVLLEKVEERASRPPAERNEVFIKRGKKGKTEK